ncbi:copper homeostasis protein CutC [Metasolibacillus sp.]|uniref:copper homeostasis protein CutC n=1 Tax=Metasolibacillus sp. TaxID=2703680 RepID=UPI0025FF0957|nr:copper homeostasis protein CutC [Metasolibacillus sp.]MCT6924733.1 copper homeostasis protein CutC [Metasolibacillus sp.]MCT6940914.1 copper homeostasis protein CutC [Metasolibacillus sp.]
MSKIEAIVLNEEDAKTAEAYGADRLELVSAIAEGGLTPSYGTIKQVVKSVQIPVMVMVRPHSYHYNYQQSEWATLLEDIRIIKELGAAGIVFGALTTKNTIDFELLSKVIEEADGLAITFHRAIDEANTLDLYKALCQSSYHVHQILTSGGQRTVPEGLTTLHALIQHASKQLNPPMIMPGAGLNVHNIASVHEVLQAQFYHFGSGIHKEGSFAQAIDVQALSQIKNILS